MGSDTVRPGEITNTRSKQPGAPLATTDAGQTVTWLLAVQLRPWLSEQRHQMLAEALETLDVRQEEVCWCGTSARSTSLPTGSFGWVKPAYGWPIRARS